MLSTRLVLLLWVTFIHIAGIYLFTRGFLLTRLSLPNASDCSTSPCTLPPTHKRAVLLVIDSLRFDFLTPNPPNPPSPFHHNVLTLPRELTASRPKNSFVFNAYADPPTTTLQRIKGLTTGSLPTFIDMGNNFGGASIAEDSILKQLSIAGKRVAFMGDDTWIPLFSESFEPNMTFPYDSFNVEDLHTVDEGVIAHLFPLLEDETKPFDFLIGHFLGVDHVGHRVGPDHPSMKAKLQQMNNVLTRAVELLDDETLLVVLGDHGMDNSGDHGGDGVLETSSALWIYSKGPELTQASSSLPLSLLQYKTFPQTTVPHRAIQQIDILPTLSLLLGLPIPYNNLGSIIPEIFWRGRGGALLSNALELNAGQVKKYLDTYRSSPSGGELDDAWDALQSAWSGISAASTRDAKLLLLLNYTRVALASCRAMWAQFNPFLMGLGLSLLGIGICASWAAYSGLSQAKGQWDEWLSIQLPRCLRGAAGGAVLGTVAHLSLASYLSGIDALDCVLFAAPLLSAIVLILSSPPKMSLQTVKSVPLILVLHAVTFFSNSFTFWEDRIIPFLLVSSILPHIRTGFTAQTSRLRYRIIGFSLLFAVCVRLMSISTVCREEQQPYCHVTFYSSSSLSSPPFAALVLALPIAISLPLAIRQFLKISRSNVGLATSFLPAILTPSLVAGAGFWILEWLDSGEVLDHVWSPFLRVGRTWLARSSIGWILIAGGALWWIVPLCLDINVKVEGENRQVTVIGFGNAFGSPYLLFCMIFLSLVYTATQLTGQLILALSVVALISYLEILDSVRDVKGMEAVFASSTPSAILDSAGTADQAEPLRFSDVIPLALLGVQAFYGTGHQSTISSFQWKTAFILSPGVSYYLAPITVSMNTFGPLFFIALAAPLLAIWNRAPLRSSKEEMNPDRLIKGESVLAALGMMTYYATLLLGTAVSAAILRRHLMVWKVFAPRFMVALMDVLTVDIALLIGVGLGVERVSRRVARMFKAISR